MITACKCKDCICLWDDDCWNACSGDCDQCECERGQNWGPNETLRHSEAYKEVLGEIAYAAYVRARHERDAREASEQGPIFSEWETL